MIRMRQGKQPTVPKYNDLDLNLPKFSLGISISYVGKSFILLLEIIQKTFVPWTPRQQVLDQSHRFQ